jgi:hypothetical protein
MSEAVQKTGNLVMIDKYAQKTALRLGVSPDSVRAEFRKLARSHVTPSESVEPEAASATQPERPSPPEYWLLKLLLLDEELAVWATAHLDPNWIQHPQVRQIVSQRLEVQRKQTWIGLPAFMAECPSELQNVITEVTAEDRVIPNLPQQLADVTLRLRNQFLDRQLAALLHRAAQSETSETDRLALLREQQELRVLKRQPLAPRT